MDRLSINEMTTYRWSFEQDVQNYTNAGIGAIGVWRQKLSDYSEAKGVDEIKNAGLRVSSLQWAGGFTGSDGRTYKDSLDDARDAIETAAALKAECLVVHTGSRAGHTHNHARRLIRSALDELVPYAEDRDITLAVEPMHPGCAGNWTFLTDINETMALLRAVGSPRFQLVFDSYHLAHDPSNIDRIGDLTEHVALVQLGDAKHAPDGEQNRAALGEGELPLEKMIAAFRASGYKGMYEVELMGEEFEAVDYDELLKKTKDAFASLIK